MAGRHIGGAEVVVAPGGHFGPRDDEEELMAWLATGRSRNSGASRLGRSRAASEDELSDKGGEPTRTVTWGLSVVAADPGVLGHDDAGLILHYREDSAAQ